MIILFYAFHTLVCLGPFIDIGFQFCRKAQLKLSSIASNYNAARLYVGIAISFLAVATTFAIYTPQPTLKLFPSTFLVSASVAYVAMMFASSYVEEEHQFWYWVAIAWATLSR